jgi:uncharacterized protein
MKYVVVLIVVALALWLLLRGRGGGAGPRGADRPEKPGGGSVRRDDAPIDIVACAHCGVHLPRTEALLDAQGRLYCGAEHRLAGPR